jgi:hypothetical protein
LVLQPDASNLNIKQTKGMLLQYVGSELEKRWNSGRRISAARDLIPHKSAKPQVSFKTHRGGGSGDKSNASHGNYKEAHTKEYNLYTQWNPCVENTH